MYKHVNAIVERKYYHDDSSLRFNVKRDYYKHDICTLYMPQQADTSCNKEEETSYEKMQKVWQYITDIEPDNVKKNIFYLYYFEHKKQEEIAYLLEISQPYIVKALRCICTKISNYLYEQQGCEASGQLLLRF